MKRGSFRILASGHMLTGLLAVVLCSMSVGCARLPVPVEVVHEDERLLVRTERVVQGRTYTHPTTLKAEEIALVLKGLSVRDQPATGPLRLFKKTAAPERLFREEELQVLAPYLVEGLRKAKPGERVAFAIYEQGKNPASERVVTSGWIAIRDPFFHVAAEYVRDLQPRSSTGNYYPFYPDLPAPPPPQEMFFEPQQFWTKDPVDGTSAVHFRDYLRAVAPPGREG